MSAEKITRLHKAESGAILDMLEAGLKPLEPYKGFAVPWKCACMNCEAILQPTHKSIMQKKGGCKNCNSNDKSVEAEQIMFEAYLEPLEPFSGNSAKKWKSKCVKCGETVFPRFADILRGKGGCKACGSRAHLTPELLSEIENIMKSAKLEPLEDYKNSTSKWRCKCLKCGNEVSPSFHNVKRGHGGCVYCQVAAFKPSQPAYFYLIHHREFASFKVGIGNSDKPIDRLESHKKSGWSVVKKYNFDSGKKAITLEKKVLRWIRKELEIPIHLTNEQFTHGGATETFSEDAISALEVLNKIDEFINEI